MALELRDCRITGPALPEPFVLLQLEKELNRRGLLPKTTGDEGTQLQDSWLIYRRKLRELILQGGPIRVRNHVIEPLIERLGYKTLEEADEVQTREGHECGGHLLATEDGQTRLRTWSVDLGIDLDAPARRGAAYRYSHVRVAQRVLLAAGERVGLITNGVELRLLISDPARPDSQIEIPIDPGWKRSRDVPDSYRLLLALACPAGLAALPEIVEKARLQQTKVTKELRVQARRAVEHFVQEILDHPANQQALAVYTDRQKLARELWREGLIVVYRLLFILKLESTDDPARSFSFTGSSLWRNTFSPTLKLAGFAQAVLNGRETGRFLEAGLRCLFRMLAEGLQTTELNVQPLGGALFGEQTTPILSSLTWGERAVACLLDQLLWTTPTRGSDSRQRVHYGPLDVEDLGRVYEALLELEPGITTEPMCRLRRAKLEVVVPVSQGERYRPAAAMADAAGDNGDDDADDDAQDAEEEAESGAPTRRGGTRVQWIEEIPPNRFYLRVGLGRKATGSYYTPHSFVRFLVQETLGPQVAERSPQDDPKPGEILKLKVLDPAMGSGHFLVEACRFLGEKLYEACRLCDERALDLESKAEKARTKAQREPLLAEAAAYRQRVIDLPDPDDELVRYLPSRSPEGQESGLSQRKAEALCRRLVAVHCLYGVDKNPLAVELAKLSLWIEAHAEGLPLTFLDHRLVVGDSLTGPFWDKLLFRPGDQQPVADLFREGLAERFTRTLHEAIRYVSQIEASVGATLAELSDKARLKAEMDRALLPFRVVAAAWAGGVMVGPEDCDDHGYGDLARTVAETGDLPQCIESRGLRSMIARGLGVETVPASKEEIHDLLHSGGCVPALPYDVAFPEVFYPTGLPHGRQGFHAVLGNPPWEGIDTSNKEFFAAFDFSIFDLRTDAQINRLIERLLADEGTQQARRHYEDQVASLKRIVPVLYQHVNRTAEGASAATPDMYQCFAERSVQLQGRMGHLGMVFPAALHSTESATGLRRLYLDGMSLESCYSFENRRELFEIHRSKKYALVVARRGSSTSRFWCAFYLHDDEWLFQDDKGDKLLDYTPDFIRETTGEQRNFLELRSRAAVPIAHAMYQSREQFFGAKRQAWAVFPTEELHTSKQRHRALPLKTAAPWATRLDPRLAEPLERLLTEGVLPICKGEHFHQFDSFWGSAPDTATTVDRMRGKEARLRASQCFRMVFRRQASSTNERTVISHLTQPGILYFDSALPERDPQSRPTAYALLLVGLCNSFPFDWVVRQLVAENVTFNYLDYVPVPSMTHYGAFLSHSATRLCAQSTGYEPLWREQLGHTWREDKPPFTWPVLAGDDERWAVRAAIDAVVADAYGLSREQYAHVLNTFSHASYPPAPQLCLERFDELQAIGLEAFTRRYDPYWDIPLNENLPQPVIDLPIPEDPAAGDGQMRLWQERGGQITMVPPGPLFDQDGDAAARGEASTPRRARRSRRPRAPGDGQTEPADERTFNELLAYLRNRGTLTSADAQELLGLSASAVRPLLRRLVDEGHAVSEGRGRGTQYRHHT